MNRKLLATAALVLSTGLLTVPSAASAKGGGGTTSTSTFPTPVSTAGPCDTDNAHNNIITESADRYQMDVELVHPDFPGGAVVHVVRLKSSSTAYVERVCLDEGWTMSKYKPDGSWSSAGGFDITVSYQNGAATVRYRHVVGGIRFDYFPTLVTGA